MLTRRNIFINGLILILVLVACTPSGNSSETSKWLPTQVRSLDPAESKPNPISVISASQDLIALYTRETDSDFQIRVDFLDLKLSPIFGLAIATNFDLYLELDLTPDNNVWENDLMIIIPAENNPIVYLNDTNLSQVLIPQVTIDGLIDTITVSIDHRSIPGLSNTYSIHAYITHPNSSNVIDEFLTAHSTDQVAPVPILLAFWNTLPAHTSAQTLRRWDGAHTGPLGERHGLKHILDASEEFQIPITLLDLKTPASLSALAALGQSANIANLQRRGLLAIPDAIPENYFGDLNPLVIDNAARISREKGLITGFAGSQLIYSPFPTTNLPSNYRLILARDVAPTNDALPKTQVAHSKDQRYILLPYYKERHIQASTLGLSIQILHELLDLGLNNNSFQIAVLGGDLPHSTWGDPGAAWITLDYISQHPWLHVLNEAELKTLHVCWSCPSVKIETSQEIDHPVIAKLQNSPDNNITDLAWQMFLDLSAPAGEPDKITLSALRASYLGDIGNLLAAAAWESKISQTSTSTSMRNTVSFDCSTDTDYDLLPECILENKYFFVLLDPQGGRVSLFFVRSSNGSIQLVGPSSQFIVGLSDSREWDLAKGPLADPAVFPGAFAGPWTAYQVEPLENGIQMTTTDITKKFLLTETGLHIEIQSNHPQSFKIPLVVAPNSRFNPEWMNSYQESEIFEGVIWGLKSGAEVEIHSQEYINNQNFLDSQIYLRDPENPNLENSPGQYIPFPMAIINLNTQNKLWVEIIINQ